MPAYKKAPSGIKGHGRLGVEFDPSHKPRDGYPKTAKEQQDRFDAEQARIGEMQRRKPGTKKMASGGCIGPECGGCSSGECYAKGGKVDDEFEPRETKSAMDPEKHQKGVHESSRFGSKGVSMAGEDQRTGLDSKEDHHRVLGELKRMKKPHLYAEGGSVDSWTKRSDNERGVHGDVKKGMSTAGHHVRHAQEHPEDREDSMGAAKLHHMKNMDEMKGMKKPNLYAEGGEVSDGEPEMEDELKHAMGGELMDALERKDRKGIMSSLEAIVLSCRGKE